MIKSKRYYYQLNKKCLKGALGMSKEYLTEYGSVIKKRLSKLNKRDKSKAYYSALSEAMRIKNDK